MSHTFILEEGTWEARGRYSDAANLEMPLEARTTVIHRANIWLNEGYMKIQCGGQSFEFQNSYEIEPLEEGKDFTRWKSYNPALGSLSGRLMIVAEVMMLTYTSDSGEYSGAECLVKINDTHYKTRGFAFQGGEKLSAWAADLIRIGS